MERTEIKITLVFSVLALASFFWTRSTFAGTLSCAVRASACGGGETAIWRMSAIGNAHAELPSQSNYSQLVCCTGVTGLGNSCSGTYATVLKLSGTTNAHAEQNSQANYANSACISVPPGGNVSVGYQSTNCFGFDTTLGSMSGTTNAHLGDGLGYTTKVCATAAAGPTGYVASGTLVSVIIDTTITGGVAPNSIWWEGALPANTAVKFQFASSNSTGGPWNYMAWNSSTNTCDSSSYYQPSGPSVKTEVKAFCHKNHRYIRYKIYLETNDSAATPTVDRVILNYAK